MLVLFVRCQQTSERLQLFKQLHPNASKQRLRFQYDLTRFESIGSDLSLSSRPYHPFPPAFPICFCIFSQYPFLIRSISRIHLQYPISNLPSAVKSYLITPLVPPSFSISLAYRTNQRSNNFVDFPSHHRHSQKGNGSRRSYSMAWPRSTRFEGLSTPFSNVPTS